MWCRLRQLGAIRPLRRLRALRRLVDDESGATQLEYAMLLAFIGIPSYWIIKLTLATLVGHYRMMTTLNALPFP